MMKALISLFLFMNCSLAVMAQDSWKVYCGKKLLLATGVSDDSANRVRLDPAVFADKNELRIIFRDADPQAGWIRHFALYRENDSELVKYDGHNEWKIPLSDLGAMLRQNGNLKVYTWSLPSDPELASRVRVRRIYLCTLVKP